MITDYKIILPHAPLKLYILWQLNKQALKTLHSFLLRRMHLLFSFTSLIKQSSLSFPKSHKCVVMSEYGVTSCTLEAEHMTSWDKQTVTFVSGW